MNQHFVYYSGMDESVFERMIRKASERDWSQTDLAVRLGVSPQNVTNWKRRGVPPDQYVNLADTLCCSLDELLGRTKYIGVGQSPAGRWPYKEIDEVKFRDLESDLAARLEGAIILAAAQLGLDVKK
jgi:transcriptional regulator with XRE-family HTH domain